MRPLTFSFMDVVFEIKACSRGYVMTIAGWLACACEARSSSSAKGMITNFTQLMTLDQQAYLIAPPSS
jgi:hypothetical protein